MTIHHIGGYHSGTLIEKFHNFFTNLSQLSLCHSSCHKFLDTLFHSDSSPCLEAQCLRKVCVEKKTLFGHNSQK